MIDVSSKSKSIFFYFMICDKYHTSHWIQGRKVRDANIPSGTAIATLPNGKYSGHAAIYISQDKDGILVWDQVYMSYY